MFQVVHLIPTLNPSWCATQLRLLTAGLSRAGIESQILVWRGQTSYMDGATLTPLNARRGLDLAAARRLSRLLADISPDIVHVWGLDGAGVAQFVASRRRAGRVVVSTGNAVTPSLGAARLARKVLASRCQRLIVPCDAIRDGLSNLGLPKTKMTSIPAGIESTAAIRPREACLAELGLPAEVNLIGTSSRLIPSRRIKDLIWSTDLLKFLRDDVHLLVFGDGPHLARLLRYRKQVRIEDRVHFLGARSDLHDWYPHLAAFWSARSTAGQPLAVLEAMAAGVPVIASDVPGLRELIVPGESGFVFPVGDRAAVARHTRQLLDDRALAQRIGERARQIVAERFQVEAMVAAYVAAYCGNP